VNSKDRQPYVYIPAGSFLMGCVPADTKCEEHEKPQHPVKLTKSLWMGETEVTVEAFKRFLEMTDPKKKLPRAPVEHEGWRTTNLPMPAFTFDDAAAFCKWAGGRLPTEAEWEYAARAGKAGEIVPLSAENAREKANFTGKKGNDRFDYVAGVKQFDPNSFGLFDMFGNLWEMTADYYDKGYYAESPAEDPKGPSGGKERVLRGGSWDSNPAQHLRISFRNKGNGGNIVGWRCVIEDSEENRKLLR
jgi:formylglycine-generating enzyme required for sulfatase activity